MGTLATAHLEEKIRTLKVVDTAQVVLVFLAFQYTVHVVLEYLQGGGIIFI